MQPESAMPMHGAFKFKSKGGPVDANKVSIKGVTLVIVTVSAAAGFPLFHADLGAALRLPKLISAGQ